MSRSDGGGSPASKDSGQVQRALADLDGESDASSVASVRGLVAGWVITSDHEMVKKCCLNHWCVRFASSFTFIFPSLSGPGDGRCRPNLGSLSEVYLGLFATGQWCSMDPSCLNTWALPGQTEVQVTQLHLLGEAPLLGPQSLPLWLQRIFWGSICFEILLTSHLRPCNHPCGQSPWMLLWPWFDGAEQHQPNAFKNCLTRSGITYSAASSASTVTEAIIMNFQCLDWWACGLQQLLGCMFHQRVWGLGWPNAVACAASYSIRVCWHAHEDMLTRRRPLLEGYAHALRPLSASQLVAFVVLASFFSLCQATDLFSAFVLDLFAALRLVHLLPLQLLGLPNPILAKVHDAGRYHTLAIKVSPSGWMLQWLSGRELNSQSTHLAAGASGWLKLWPPICCTPGSTS